jgi:hypothetical protein
MPTKRYIVVEFGAPHAVDKLSEIVRMSRLAILSRTWEHAHAFDENTRYRWQVLDPPQIGWFSRFLTHSIYNPTVDVRSEWLPCGAYSSADLISLVTDGLAHDDDIIQQWFGAEEVIRLLTCAKSWHEMVLAVEAIAGSHEVDAEVSKYVAQVLNNRSNDE